MVDKKIKNEFCIKSFHTAFKFQYSDDFEFGGERHDFWECNILTSGELLMTQDEKVFELEGGAMIFHPPMAFHRFRCASGTKPTGYTFAFGADGELPKRLYEGAITLTGKQLEDISELINLMIEFVNDEEHDSYHGQLTAALLSRFIIEVARDTGKSASLSSQSAKEYKAVIEIMHASVRDNLTLSEVSKKANISKSYLKLLFTKYAGISPKSYYSSLIADEAARLLREGLSAREVSEELSFSSENYFSLFFKKHFGITPSRYAHSFERNL